MSQSPLPIDRQRSLRSESNELFGLLIESVRDYAIFVLDPEGYVLTWNPGAEALKGYTREEIIGKSFLNLLSIRSDRKRLAAA
jgi:PAS domain S-box-containing protein